MALTLRSLDDAGMERKIETGKPFSIGRGTDNDMVLVDPTREVSKTHCRIESDGDRFVLVDLSINGVMLEGREEPMGPGVRHTLATGDIFIVGRQRFAVSVADPVAENLAPAALPDFGGGSAPSNISHILDGGSEGEESRASAGVTGESARWLGTLPLGSADETMRQPMGWDEPPGTGAPILPPDFDQPASDFANRSEHVPAPNSALHLPRSQQVIPMDWLDDATAPASPTMAAPNGKVSSRAAAPSVNARRALTEGGRLDPAGIAGITDDDLLRRCGEALRACLDAFDAIEAAQAVAERDCGVSTQAEGALWTDFFSTNRDPLLSLLAEQHPGPAQALAQRAAALADRQRALGHAVSDAAHRYEAALAPASIEAETKSRFKPGPLARAAAWSRFAQLHAELAAQAEGEATPNFLILLKKSFARAMTKRP